MPRFLIVFAVLFAGVFLFFLIQKPHSVCDSQFEIFREAQKGKILPGKTKTGTRPPVQLKAIRDCKMGQTPGSCYEAFENLRALVRDLKNLPNECGEEIGQIPEAEAAIKSGLEVMIRIAWGESPPDRGLAKMNWFESADLALFCALKDQWQRFYSSESTDSFRTQLFGSLPGEKPVVSEGKCLNCESRKTAGQILTPDEIWSRSLFSVRCIDYR